MVKLSKILKLFNKKVADKLIIKDYDINYKNILLIYVDNKNNNAFNILITQREIKE